MKKTLSLLCVVALLCSVIPLQAAAADGAVNAKPKVIPSLQQWTGGTGAYTIDDTSRIVYDGGTELKATAELFQEDLIEITGHDLAVVNGEAPKNGDFYLTFTDAEDPSIGDEGYLFEVGDYAAIRANTQTGVFYGTRTALQILEQDAEKDSIAKGTAKDFPKYEERGFMLDVGRKFIPMSDLKEYVKIMSYYKLNDFQIHLNDNEIFKDNSREHWNKYEAFRLESTKYPEMTAKDGHYTKQDFRELQDLANVRGLTITPEIDTPSHALSLTKIKPELVKDNMPVDHLDITRPETIAFIKDVWDEYLDGDWFDSDTVHFGADEFAPNDPTTFEAYREFLNIMNDHFKSKGKKARMWGSLKVFPGTTEVDKDIIVHAWSRGWQDPVTSVAEGFKVINTLDAYLYMVPKAGYYRDYLDKQWLFNNWTPAFVGGNPQLNEGEPNLLGGMFAIWNDMMGRKVSSSDVHDRFFKAVPVMAEKMWRGKSTDSTFAEFDRLSDLLGTGPGSNLFHEVDTASDLVVHYPLEEGSAGTTADLSGNSYDGSVNGAAWTNEGKAGGALLFDDLSDHIATDLTTKGFPWTASAWVKLDADSQSDEVVFMESGFGALKLKQKGSPFAGFTREGFDYTFNTSIPTDRWVHIAFQGDLSGTTLFMDGEFKSKVADNTLLPASRIGSKTNALQGTVDEIKLYDRLLTSNEIAAEAGSPPWTVNIAMNKPATASSVEVSAFPANLAFDGSVSSSSRWSSAHTDNEWISVDLGERQDISKVVLKWEGAYAKGYKLQVSDDAQSWTDVYATSAGVGGVETIKFPTERAKYVRMLGTKRAGTYGFSLYEFEVYPPNPNDPVPVPVPVRYGESFEDQNLDNWIHPIGAAGTKSLRTSPSNANEHAVLLTANNTSNVFVDQSSPAVKDGEIEFKITPQTDGIRAGLIFRYVNEGQWASVGFDNGSWYWVNAQDSYGRMTNSAGAQLKKGVTSTVKVKFEGTHITLIVNGTAYFEGAITALPNEAGRMGARVFGGTAAIFDDFLLANNVAEVPVTGIELNKPAIVLQEGETTEISALIKPGSATNKTVDWASSNEEIARVELVDGKAIITAISAGTAEISATTQSGGFTAVSQVTVLASNSDQPATTITAPDRVTAGESFKVRIGLQNLEKAVYAQDLLLTYDADLMEFVSAGSLMDGVSLVEAKPSTGAVRLVLASQGEANGVSGDQEVVELTFAAKQLQQSGSGTITAADANLGYSDGTEENAASSTASITFVMSEPNPDVNGDDRVSIGDLAIVAANYGKTDQDPDWNAVKRADVNMDGKIDLGDLAAVAQAIIR
ncbi:family 20 glycosylhydrolase [Paenibacillus sp. LHD-117]|uniref:family 20 glycosylhydrolase n=1 Tax=Paenibacillus sp. LHD-117 TaxID=3071412 RepID=UPI0027DF7622|nr:family 20 glycosylhydrolase [Paenibacillus sp. LHD-117]MDQ6422159.1 family 20 glycosylhydrolase [Paenibacillus sp. LHD-117]